MNSQSTPTRIDPLEDLVGDLFVDRDFELNFIWEWGSQVPPPSRNSIALIGRRRTGKTSILTKGFNRLFYEQTKVVPVFISFSRYLHRQKPISGYEFASEYFRGYLGSYLAFTYRHPALLGGGEPRLSSLQQFASAKQDEYALGLIDAYQETLSSPLLHDLMQWIINFPKHQARFRNMPTAIMIDEFQVLTNVYNPQNERYYDLTDSFQRASETKWAPLLVSGSSISLLVGQALGGLLSGRFKYWYLKPLTREYVYDLVFRLANKYHIKVDDALTEAIWQLTGGYPYSVECLMTSWCPARQAYPSLDALEEVVSFELTNPAGYLSQHYREEFGKYTKLLNDGQTTRKVMLWATKYPDERIQAEHVAKQLGLEVTKVRESLEKLRWADVVEKVGLISYQVPNDPMMRRYIEYEHYTEIENLAPAEAIKDWKKEYNTLRGRMNNLIGEVAEIYVEAVMRAFSGPSVDGKIYFNDDRSITLPVFNTLERRGGIVSQGIPVEIDILGEWDQKAWVVQVKNTRDKVSPSQVAHFLAQISTLKAAKAYTSVTGWMVSKHGFTKDATTALQKAGLLFSDREAFNKLAKLVGFFGWPE
ncbi:MAG: ATP-binding protein [Ardenticatenaceae bacterium]